MCLRMNSAPRRLARGRARAGPRHTPTVRESPSRSLLAHQRESIAVRRNRSCVPVARLANSTRKSTTSGIVRSGSNRYPKSQEIRAIITRQRNASAKAASATADFKFKTTTMQRKVRSRRDERPRILSLQHRSTSLARWKRCASSVEAIESVPTERRARRPWGGPRLRRRRNSRSPMEPRGSRQLRGAVRGEGEAARPVPHARVVRVQERMPSSTRPSRRARPRPRKPRAGGRRRRCSASRRPRNPRAEQLRDARRDRHVRRARALAGDGHTMVARCT